MADVNASSGQAPAMAPPVRTDDQILPRIRWVPIGKSNCYLDLEKSQRNPIYKIAVDLLKNTNFFRAFTASSTIPSIYIQQFWDTVQYDKKAGSYRCQLDEQWFVLTKDTLREALQITLLGFHFTRHKFHPRPDSPLHLPNEEPVLGYLKFSANGTKREVFGMPIPGNLVTKDIQEASYYQEYLANVTKHRRYLAGKKRSLKNVAESVAEDEPTKEPQVAAIDTDLQKALKESMKTAYAVAPQGPLPPVVIREPESGKYQPLPEVPGKGKAKVTEEQVAHDLLSLQKPKRKSHVDQYIFQRRVSEPIGSSGHDESPYDVLGQSDSEEESKKVVLGADEGGQDEGQAGPDPGAQAEGQMGSDAGARDEGQAGSNPDENSKGQARPDPGNARDDVHSIPSPVVHAGSDREHIDLDVADVSPQPSTEQLDEGFTATAYPKVQENLQACNINFGDLFFSDKPSDADKNAETEVESMVNVLIQQLKRWRRGWTNITTTTSSTTKHCRGHDDKRIGELEHIMANLIQVNKEMEERLDKHGARLYTLEQLDIPQLVSKAVTEVVTDAVDWAMQAPLRNRFRDLPKADMKEILHQRMWETESYKSHEDHMQLFEALEKSINRDHSEELAQDLAEAHKKKKKSHESPKMPPGSPPYPPPPPPLPAGPSGASRAPEASGSSQVPPPPPPHSSTNQESQSKGFAAPSSSKTVASAEYQAWTTTEIKLRPSISLTPADLEMDKDMGPDEQARSSDDEDIGSAHIPKASALASNYSPPLEDSLLAQTGNIATFIDWFCKRRECHKLLTDNVDDPILRHNVSKPLPMGGPPGQVTIQSDFFFNKYLEYLRYDSKGSRPALSISKMKAAYYPDAGLEQMVPDQFWIDEECKYDIVVMYGISHWWFQRQRFYIDRHTSEGDRGAVRTHMRILSVVRIEVFFMYGYDYMKKIVLHRADLNEHVIAERDFKYLYPSDFEDLYLLNLQGHLNHLLPKDKKILTTAMMMRFNEIHKFSDCTLQQIDEALDYRVKEFRINRMNPEAFEDKEDLLQPGELCWWTTQRGILQTSKAYRMIKSFRHSRPLSDDLINLHNSPLSKVGLGAQAHGYVRERSRKGLGEVSVYGRLSWGRWVNMEFCREKRLLGC
nr:histone deacetylase 14 [Tanacetum cinerariifolium]